MNDDDFFSSIKAPRKKYVTLRLDEDAAKMIRSASKKAGRTQSDVIRYLFKVYAEYKKRESK